MFLFSFHSSMKFMLANRISKTFPVSNFLKSATSGHCSNDTKEAEILYRCGLPLNEG